jgi:septal ring factor EnvC (AmiA/AmiB activator)
MARRMLAIARSVALLAAVLAVGAGVLSGEAGAQRPDATTRVPLEEARGKLPWPVVGALISGFGQRTPDGEVFKGLVLEGYPDAVVVSPWTCLVVYAGKFRKYGPMVIVSAGDGYHFLLAGLLAIDAQVGQQLTAGEPIGYLGRTDGTRPRLRLELLKDQRAIDPAPWLRKS